MGQKAKKFRFPEWYLRWEFTRQWTEKKCSHLHQITVRETDVAVCEDCVALGDEWPELRLCLICGYVGCCDGSKNKHMKQHVEATGHPLVRTIQPGQGWIWCYTDDAFIGSHSKQLDRPMGE